PDQAACASVLAAVKERGDLGPIGRAASFTSVRGLDLPTATAGDPIRKDGYPVRAGDLAELRAALGTVPAEDPAPEETEGEGEEGEATRPAESAQDGDEAAEAPPGPMPIYVFAQGDLRVAELRRALARVRKREVRLVVEVEPEQAWAL